jgi:hypothetical protein
MTDSQDREAERWPYSRSSDGIWEHQGKRFDEALALLRDLAGRDERSVLDVLARLADDAEPASPAKASSPHRGHQPSGTAMALCRQLAECGSTWAMCILARWLELEGRGVEAERWLRRAAEYGHARAMTYGTGERSTAELARFLRRAGREDDAESVLQLGLEPGGRTADPWT